MSFLFFNNIDGVMMDGYLYFIVVTPASTSQNIGCPFIMTLSKMNKTKKFIFYSLIPQKNKLIKQHQVLSFTNHCKIQYT